MFDILCSFLAKPTFSTENRVKANLFHYQAIQAGLVGPGRPSSGSRLLPGPVHGSSDPVRGRVLWRPALWQLVVVTPAEEVQRHHEAGCVRGTCGNAEVPGSHSGTGNDEEAFSWAFTIST